MLGADHAEVPDLPLRQDDRADRPRPERRFEHGRVREAEAGRPLRRHLLREPELPHLEPREDLASRLQRDLGERARDARIGSRVRADERGRTLDVVEGSRPERGPVERRSGRRPRGRAPPPRGHATRASAADEAHRTDGQDADDRRHVTAVGRAHGEVRGRRRERGDEENARGLSSGVEGARAAPHGDDRRRGEDHGGRERERLHERRRAPALEDGREVEAHGPEHRGLRVGEEERPEEGEGKPRAQREREAEGGGPPFPRLFQDEGEREDRAERRERQPAAGREDAARERRGEPRARRLDGRERERRERDEETPERVGVPERQVLHPEQGEDQDRRRGAPCEEISEPRGEEHQERHLEDALRHPEETLGEEPEARERHRGTVQVRDDWPLRVAEVPVGDETGRRTPCRLRVEAFVRRNVEREGETGRDDREEDACRKDQDRAGSHGAILPRRVVSARIGWHGACDSRVAHIQPPARPPAWAASFFPSAPPPTLPA